MHLNTPTQGDYERGFAKQIRFYTIDLIFQEKKWERTVMEIEISTQQSIQGGAKMPTPYPSFQFLSFSFSNGTTDMVRD